MKTVFAFMLLSFASLPAFAAEVVEGNPCPLEGERAYLTNAEDRRNFDVFTCEKGIWTFLYTTDWSERD